MVKCFITALFLFIATMQATFGKDFQIFGIDLDEDAVIITMKLRERFAEQFGPCGYKEFDNKSYQCPKDEPTLPHIRYFETYNANEGRFYKELLLLCEVYRGCSQSDKVKEMLETRWGIEFEYKSDMTLGYKKEEYFYVYEKKRPDGSAEFKYFLKFMPSFSFGGLPISGFLQIKKFIYGQPKEPIFD